ncbi:MAG: hypothetical protein WC494_02840 [Candidatus Pacearchaeota archaeon]
MEELSAGFVKDQKVVAEVLDFDAGFVSEPVSLVTSEDGFFVFPEITIKEAVTFHNECEKLLVNRSELFLNISTEDGYDNIKYSVNSGDGFFEVVVCEECNSAVFLINLFKGENNITITAYGDREVSKNFSVYSLDYLEIKRDISCMGCSQRRGTFLIPPSREILVKITINSSHEVSGILEEYFPVEFESGDSLDFNSYSLTHNYISNYFSGKEFEFSYELKSPRVFFPRVYLFSSKFYNIEVLDNVRVSRFFFLPGFFYFKNLEKENPFMKRFRVGSTHPLVIKSNDSILELVAVYPKGEKEVKASLDERQDKESRIFEIVSSLQDFEIDKIYLRFKVRKNQNVLLFSEREKIPVKKYNEDRNNDYYEAWIKGKNFEFLIG